MAPITVLKPVSNPGLGEGWWVCRMHTYTEQNTTQPQGRQLWHMLVRSSINPEDVVWNKSVTRRETLLTQLAKSSEQSKSQEDDSGSKAVRDVGLSLSPHHPHKSLAWWHPRGRRDRRIFGVCWPITVLTLASSRSVRDHVSKKIPLVGHKWDSSEDRVKDKPGDMTLVPRVNKEIQRINSVKLSFHLYMWAVHLCLHACCLHTQ